MTKCGYCGSTIVIGGVRSGGQRFCNNKCLVNGQLLGIAEQVPTDVLDRNVEEIFRGLCPKCRQLGPIDVHKVHRVWSAIVLTRWSTSAQVSCRSCAMKSQLGGALFSLMCGWWGFPWGLILTPVQISRNILAMCARPDSSRPSADLRKLVMVNIAAQAIQKNQQTGPPAIPS